MGDREPTQPAGQPPIGMSPDSKEWAERVADARARRARALAARAATGLRATAADPAGRPSASSPVAGIQSTPPTEADIFPPPELLPQPAPVRHQAVTLTEPEPSAGVRPVAAAVIAFALGVAVTLLWMGWKNTPASPDLSTRVSSATDAGAGHGTLAGPAGRNIAAIRTARRPTAPQGTLPKDLPLSNTARIATAPATPPVLERDGAIDPDFLKNLVRSAQ